MSKLETGADGIDCSTLRETLGGTGPGSDKGQIALHLLHMTLGTRGPTCLGQADKTWKQSAKDDLEVKHQHLTFRHAVPAAPGRLIPWGLNPNLLPSSLSSLIPQPLSLRLRPGCIGRVTL